MAVLGSFAIGPEMIYPEPDLGRENWACAFVLVGVAIAGWLYELPRDGSLADPSVPLVFGREADGVPWIAYDGWSDAALI